MHDENVYMMRPLQGLLKNVAFVGMYVNSQAGVHFLMTRVALMKSFLLFNFCEHVLLASSIILQAVMLETF